MLRTWVSKEGGEGSNFLPLREPQGLIKGEKQGLREVAAPRETYFNQGNKLP